MNFYAEELCYSSVLNRTTGPNRTHASGLWKKHTPNSAHGSESVFTQSK